MTNGKRTYVNTGASAAVVLLSVAVAIVVSYALNDWWIFVPLILLEMGLYLLFIGLTVGRPAQGMPWTKSDSNFYLFWGNILCAVGALLILNLFYPGNVIILVVVLLVWLAVFALLFSMRKRSG
jgi:hypothetical protein